MNIQLFRKTIAVLVMLTPAALLASQSTVSDVTVLNDAVGSAVPGDTIFLADGTYLDANLTVSADSVAIMAEHAGKVFLNGATSINLAGNGITFSGFQFTEGSITGNVVEINGNHDSISNCNFNGFSAKKYISVSDLCQYADISYCTIENKPETAPSGCTVQIGVSATQPGYHTIRWCEFKNFPGAGGDFGNEPIRIGLSTQSFVSRTVVEHCYFTKVGKGDSESISLKSHENVIRFCTFDDNPDGMLVFRNGDRNIAYGNYFINGSGGVRLKETNDDFIYNNYFERSGETGSTDAITLLYVAPNLKNINFIHNTFVDCGAIDLGGVGPTAVTFANNIFKKSTGTIFFNDNGASTFTGNIFSGTTGITISSEMTEADPLLAKNSEGLNALTAGSPAIDAASDSYPAITDIESIDDDPSILTDFDGTVRPASATQKDVGCDEYAETGKSQLMKEFDGGVAFLKTDVVGIGAISPEQNGSTSLFTVSGDQLRITLANPAAVSIKLFDLRGRELFRSNRFMNSGNQVVPVRSLTGNHGVAICQVSVGNQSQSMKMNLP